VVTRRSAFRSVGVRTYASLARLDRRATTFRAAHPNSAEVP
jgi:hypothetical protein